MWFLLFLGIGYAIAQTQYPPNFENVVTLVEPEDTQIGTKLTTLTATDRDEHDVITISRADSNTAQMVNLSILPDNPGNTKRADVILAKALDRDQGIDRVQLNFQATDGSLTSFTTVTVFVEDVNDNPPTFKQPFYLDTILENSTIGEIYDFKIEADDPDNGNNAAFTYRLEAAGQSAQKYQGIFDIANDGKIIQRAKLNYENLTFYQYRIIATDRGEPPLSGSADLTIKVEDVQDTPPYFLGLPYRTTVLENAEKLYQSKEILRVEAFDGDQGVSMPRQVHYSFRSESQCLQYFEVNEVSGAITTKAELDADSGTIFHNQGVCSLVIQAAEEGAPLTNLTTSTTTVTVTVQDVNDNIPTFNQTVYEAEVAENWTNVPITIKEFVGIFVQDIDQTNNNAFDLTISYGNGTAVKDVVPTPSSVRGYATVQIRLQNNFAFDYEKEQHVNFTLIASEKNKKSNCTVKIRILNRNDNFPIFSKDEYNASLYENSPNGTSVIQVKANDADLGDYGSIRYSIRGTNGILRIDEEGTVYTICEPGKLDRETRDTYYFTVEARDGGDVSTSVQLVITLLDRNDNAPKFQQGSYDVSIPENSYSFSMDPFQLSASDNDEENTPNSLVMYGIDAGYLSANFTINRTTGIIQLIEPLDYEQLQSENVIIVANASDQGDKVLTTLLNITVRVLDMNDNDPYFDARFYYTSIPENAASGSSVYTVNAMDDDGQKPNNEINYSITSGSFDIFRIDRGRGLITVDIGAELDRETRSLYNVTIIAIDRGSPALSGSTNLFLNVTDINDEKPRFLQDNFVTSCYENISVKQVVANCSASDPDTDALLVFEIISTRGTNSFGQSVNESIVKEYFEIRPDNGLVHVKSSLDRETASQIIMVIQVNDTNGVKQQTATTTLTINIKDINDEPPVFTKAVYEASVSESAKEGTNVIAVTATDSDINTHITYSIIDERLAKDTETVFKIDPDTGTIVTNKAIDREKSPEINITVSAFDGVNTTTCLVIVTVQDINDNYPQFLPYINNVTVVEGNYTNQRMNIAVVNATDADEISSGNGKVTYHLESAQSGIFEINETTGDISVVSNLDREHPSLVTPSYSLTITARDNPEAISERRTSSTKLTVTILDINDNHPQFDNSGTFEFSVLETESVNSTITTIKASDPDNGQNGTEGIQYKFEKITEESKLFFIDVKGTLKIAQSVIDKPGKYKFAVVATDGGNLSTSQNITIEVTDVNNNPPVFKNISSRYSIYECARIGTVVATIHATDKDKGHNAEIVYAFVNETESRSSDFKINEEEGHISLAPGSDLDHHSKPSYTIRVIAKDKGVPALSVQSGPITINVVDVNDHPPEFEHDVHVSHFNENEVGHVTTVKATDKDSISEIEYIILDSKFSEYFEINKTDEVYLVKRLDREATPVVNITVNAKDVTKPVNLSDQCDGSLPIFNNTQQIVMVHVLDKNDNPPVFIEQKSFNVGVRQEREGGKVQEVFNFQDKVTDQDSPQNSVHTFGINGQMRYSAGFEDKIKSLKPDNCPQNHEPKGPSPLCLSSNGTLSTNMLFDTGLEGHITLQVIASDQGGHDSADLKVFFIADSQIVQITFGKTKEDVRKLAPDLLSNLSNLTNHQFVADGIQEASGHTIQTPRTRLLFHVVERGTNRILSSPEVISLIDGIDYELRYRLTDHYGVHDIQKLQGVAEEETDEKSRQLYILAGVVALQALILVVVVYFSCNSSSKYKRKLKAATIHSTGSVDKKENTNDSFFPGSNLYAATTNPILNKKIKVPEADKVSLKSTNSLDANEVVKGKLGPEYECIEEKEAVVDMYGDDYYKPDLEIDALKLVLQDYENFKEEEVIQDQEDEYTSIGAINPVFDMETTDV